MLNYINLRKKKKKKILLKSAPEHNVIIKTKLTT